MDEINIFTISIYIDEIKNQSVEQKWRGAIIWHIHVGLELKIVPTEEWKEERELLKKYLMDLDKETKLIVYLETIKNQTDQRLLRPIFCDADVEKTIEIIRSMARELAISIAWE